MYARAGLDAKASSPRSSMCSAAIRAATIRPTSPSPRWPRDGRKPRRTPMRIVLAQPRGFCAGVVRAIDIVEGALRRYDVPVYVRHEIVHNKHVVDGLKAKGARFVEQLRDSRGAVAIFSAHGVSKQVEIEAADARPHGP